MWVNAGFLRSDATLREGLERADGVRGRDGPVCCTRESTAAGWRKRSPCAASRGAILGAALARTESRGAHFRNDFPAAR